MAKKNLNLKKWAILAVIAFAVSEFFKAKASDNRSANITVESNIDLEKWIAAVKSDPILASKIQGLKGDKGLKGDQGIQGIQGVQGLKGDKGDKGDAGQDASEFPVAVFNQAVNLVQETDVLITHNLGLANPENIIIQVVKPNADANRGDLVQYNFYASEFNENSVKVNIGPWTSGSYQVKIMAGGSAVDFKGDKGDQGIQGIQGIQGVQGVKGDKGDKGDAGQDASVLPSLFYKETANLVQENDVLITHNLGLANPENVVVQIIKPNADANRGDLIQYNAYCSDFTADSLKVNIGAWPSGSYIVKVLAGTTINENLLVLDANGKTVKANHNLAVLDGSYYVTEFNISLTSLPKEFTLIVTGQDPAEDGIELTNTNLSGRHFKDGIYRIIKSLDYDTYRVEEVVLKSNINISNRTELTGTGGYWEPDSKINQILLVTKTVNNTIDLSYSNSSGYISENQVLEIVNGSASSEITITFSNAPVGYSNQTSFTVKPRSGSATVQPYPVEFSGVLKIMCIGGDDYVIL